MQETAAPETCVFFTSVFFKVSCTLNAMSEEGLPVRLSAQRTSQAGAPRPPAEPKTRRPQPGRQFPEGHWDKSQKRRATDDADGSGEQETHGEVSSKQWRTRLERKADSWNARRPGDVLDYLKSWPEVKRQHMERREAGQCGRGQTYCKSVLQPPNLLGGPAPRCRR